MSNPTNISYLNSLLLANIRFTYLTDSLNLYFIVPMTIIGTCLNILTIGILNKMSFKSMNMNIYKLMFINSLVSFLITFYMIFLFLNTPYILFDLSISLA